MEERGYPTLLTDETFGRIEYLIHNCLWDQKQQLIDKLMNMQYEIEAEEFILWLYERQPEPGRDCTPHTIEDQKKAIDYSVTKDDFYERKKN